MQTTIETTGIINGNRQLTLDEDFPENVSGGKVRVIVFFDQDEDLSEKDWLKAASQNEAFEFLNEEDEDIYTLEDGKPLTDET